MPQRPPGDIPPKPRDPIHSPLFLKETAAKGPGAIGVHVREQPFLKLPIYGRRKHYYPSIESPTIERSIQGSIQGSIPGSVQGSVRGSIRRGAFAGAFRGAFGGAFRGTQAGEPQISIPVRITSPEIYRFRRGGTHF